MQDAGQRARRRVDGVVLLDKPLGLSSNRALQAVKRVYGALKGGHSGTLDPLATGLLPLCLGEATKFAQGLLDSTKRYRASVCFGVATATGDAEGEVIQQSAVDFGEAELRAVLVRFLGRIQQVPPRFSALKWQGRSYYEYAREGIEIERKPREIEIVRLELVEWQPPLADLDIVCSKGSYVRTLAEDIGLALGSCAHLAGLRRTGVGPYTIESAVALPVLETASPDALARWLLPADTMVHAHPRVEVDAASALALKWGQAIAATQSGEGVFRCYAPEGFLGLVTIAAGSMRAARLLRTDG